MNYRLKRDIPGAKAGTDVKVVAGNKCYVILNRENGETLSFCPKEEHDMWVEESVPKRWRAENKEKYYYINETGFVDWHADVQDENDNRDFEFGNYFSTESEARVAALKVKELLVGLAKMV